MRKIISVLLAVILVFTLAAPAMAATVKQEASSAAIKAGEEVTVTVTLDEDVADIVMYQYSLYYNKDLFTMTGSTGSAVVSNPLADEDGDYFMISFVDTTSEGVTISAGTLAALTFQAKEDMTEEQAASFLLRQDYFWDTSYEDIDGISLENGTVSVTVSPAVPDVQQYTVTLPENPVGYTITPTEGSVSPVEEGGSFSFTITVNDGYEGTPVVKAGETELTAVDGVYTIADITANQTVTVEGITQKVVEPATYTVTLPENPVGYTITPTEGSVSPVEEGGSYSFTVTVNEGYEGTPSVSANSTALGEVDGVYTITNITADQTVEVTGIREEGLPADKVIYQNGSNGQQWPYGVPVFINNLTLKGLAVTDVSWDAAYENCTVTLHKKTSGDASFSLTAQVQVNGQPQMISMFSATVNGQSFTGNTFTYSGSLENGAADIVFEAKASNYSGTKNFHLVVDGTSAEPEPETYEVTLTEDTGYTIAAAEGSVSPVEEGGSFSFTVTVNEGYEGTPVVKANDTELSAENGVYTIENITADQTVTVEGITAIPNTYTVTLTEGVGYTIAAAEGSTSPVTEGSSFFFTVSVNNGYEGTPVVKANDTELTAENGIYTIANISASQTVTVEGITLKDNMYTVAASADVTASKGGNASVDIHVTGNSNEEIAGYNDYDITLSYDPDALTYVSAAAAHSGAEISHDSASGTIRVIGHGEAKAYTDAVVTLNLTANISGIHTVAITSAKIDNSGNAIALDAPEAAVSDKDTAVKVAYPVTLPENFTGDESVLPGGDYQFTAPSEYYEITVTVDGEKVTPEIDGLVYTLRGVSGDVVITAVGKTYEVTKNGDHATITGEATAQYGKDYSFTVAAESGYAITNVSVQVGGTAVDYSISNGTYVISGSKITGDVTITVTTQLQAANTTRITFEGVDASEVVGGLVQYVTNGQDFTFELNEEEGYVYTVKLDGEELEPTDGIYTIPGERINGTALTISISKEVYSFHPEVTVSQYIQLDRTVMWLVTATEGETVLSYGEGNTMFWSDKYNAYCWLVVSAESEDTVKQTAESSIIAAAEDAVVTQVGYDFDVNQTGAVDINDAQLTYDMYQAKLYSGFDTVTMDKFLEADANGDGAVNVEDAAAVVAQLLK